MNISIIGYGNMGKALCQGLLTNPNYHLQVASPSLANAQPAPRLTTHPTNLAILPDAQILILAVKPAQMAAVLTEIGPHLTPSLLVISIAAGLDLDWFAKYLPQQTPLVRAIPNIAAACSQSATPLLANSWVTAEHHAAGEAMLGQAALGFAGRIEAGDLVEVHVEHL
ncbi:MAG: NAD(P)-binding domain-containing protein, partial [Gammaproteobacteria bacterium]